MIGTIAARRITYYCLLSVPFLMLFAGCQHGPPMYQVSGKVRTRTGQFQRLAFAW